MKRTYTVSAVIRFDPVVSNIVTGQKNRRGMGDFTDFLAKQATMVISSEVVERVANDLAGKGLKFFGEQSGTLGRKTGSGRNENDAISHLASALKKAVLDETITARPPRRGEAIVVSMRWTDAEEAKKIVDSFISNYEALVYAAPYDGEKRPGRISSTKKADIAVIREIRGHYTVVLLIGFLVFGTLSFIPRGRASSLTEKPQR